MKFSFNKNKKDKEESVFANDQAEVDAKENEILKEENNENGDESDVAELFIEPGETLEPLYDEEYDDNENHRAKDGTENDEHILDMITQSSMLFANIQDNTDMCFSIFKAESDRGLIDKDIVDAYKIICEEVIAIEKEATPLFNRIVSINEAIEDGADIDKARVERLYNDIADLEKKSKEKTETFLKSYEDAEAEKFAKKEAEKEAKEKMEAEQAENGEEVVEEENSEEVSSNEQEDTNQDSDIDKKEKINDSQDDDSEE